MLALRVLDDLMNNGWDKRQDGNFVLGYRFESKLDIPFRHDNEGVRDEAGAEAVRMQTISMMQGKECKRY